jgi:Flp pilus assembly protein TadB
MIWIPVAAIGFLLLLGPCVLAIGAWVRAQDAQERLKAYELRIAELEARAGIARPRPAAARAAASARAAAAGDGSALEERIALVWFSRIGVAVMLLGAAWFFFSPGDTAGGRAVQLAVGGAAGLAALALTERGRGRTPGA